MEQVRKYRISVLLIFVFIVAGILLGILCILAFSAAPIVSIMLFTCSIFTIGSSIYLWRKRNEGKEFFWDDEGIVVDLKGNKVYWDEIEDIQFFKSSTSSFSKATVIYPHYTNHEKIRIRHKKWMPKTAHSIDWILIEKPKEYHKNLMHAWEEKNNLPK
ncbi:hypothetical protein [Bacillus sp. X1(2014)]|uniref:hypothetical protein n=1 Tax=Bacillus sp. X1(2014) TaxID=1565991 RepID=UPI0021B46D77|nr:hypothetical protein [Bacillus sp. X1(2014)]